VCDTLIQTNATFPLHWWTPEEPEIKRGFAQVEYVDAVLLLTPCNRVSHFGQDGDHKQQDCEQDCEQLTTECKENNRGNWVRYTPAAHPDPRIPPH
jgi:hypothetical protein